jgi:hypothetical protein
MLDSSLFHGIVVVIDDEIEDPRSEIHAIQTQIEGAGCSVVGMKDIPEGPKLENLRAASFFVVDWNLSGVSLGEDLGSGVSPLPPRVKIENEKRVTDFLQRLQQVRFAPVFIFTAQPIDEVIGSLKKHPDLYDESAPSHIFVKTKNEVRDSGVFKVLEDALQRAPSAYVLKVWEREYERAKNELFLDFYTKSVVWPLIFWKTFEDDGVPPSVELGNLIGRNLLSRMTPFKFDLDSFKELVKSFEANPEKYRDILIKVLEGEIFLSKERLHSDSIAPGDIFRDGGHYWVNIRADCDCIARAGEPQDAVSLYLLKGDKLSPGQVKYDPQYGAMREQDTETVIFPIHDGKSVAFQFRELSVKSWGEYKEKRIGRLLPPFLTRLQQRYSAYSQRPGLTRVPKEAIASKPPDPLVGLPSPMAVLSTAAKPPAVEPAPRAVVSSPVDDVGIAAPQPLANNQENPQVSSEAISTKQVPPKEPL